MLKYYLTWNSASDKESDKSPLPLTTKYIFPNFCSYILLQMCKEKSYQIKFNSWLRILSIKLHQI